MYKKKTREEKEKEIKLLIEDAENKVNKYFDSSKNIKEYLSFMSKFYNYSLSNTILINNQFSGAIAVGSYAFWKEKGFSVNKGEKGIKILVPNKGKDRFENEKGEIKTVDKATAEEKKKIEQGIYEIYKGSIYFTQGYIFDISQTNAKAKDLPKIFPNRWLEGNILNYNLLYKGMEKIAEKIHVKIIQPKSELGVAKGVSYTATKEVALNPRNSELQNIKTLLHELTHAKLHTKDNLDKYKTHEKEFQAELTAYTICSHFGIDTSEYSFKYLSEWTKGRTLNDKKNLLKEVKETSIDYIEILEDVLLEKDKHINIKYIDEGSELKEKSINTKDDEFLKEYLEKQRRKSLAKEKKKDFNIDI
ncbi:TPA: ImmA/IrrE family metallo-endopeptidase [Clostridium botulinum]|nr:ImmA/IrrE family metallo-endopeptidase [Clostridium botulinum]